MTETAQQVPPQMLDEEIPTVDFFGFRKSDKFNLTPDGKQWMSFHAMNEGEKRSFQQKTTRDFVIDSKTRDTRVSVDPGTERRILIETCLDDWCVYRNGKKVPGAESSNQFKVAVGDFLSLADPSVIEKIERFVRDLNPWLLDNISVEDIDEEIQRLEQQKRIIQERNAGEGS